MEVHKNTSLAVFDIGNRLHWTLILMDKSSFRFISYPWVGGSWFQGCKSSKMSKILLDLYQNKRYIGCCEGYGTS